MKLKTIPTGRRAMRDADDPMPLATTQDIDAPTASDVRGLIDNATSDRLFGWAWDAANAGKRLKVELRLAGEVVANTVADFVRPDLAKNGIGDGCHAFEFPLTRDWAERRSELTAVALGIDGTEFPIAVRIRRPDDQQVSTQLQRLVEGVMAEQGAIREEFAAMRERAALLPTGAEVEAINGAQQDLNHKIETLELWLTRLDGKLADVSTVRPVAREGRLDGWQAAMIAVLASAASAALAFAVAGTYRPW